MKKDIVFWMRIMIFLDKSEEIHKIIRIVSSREFDWIIEKNSRVFCFFTLIIEKERKRLRNKTIRKLNIKEKAKWKNEKKGERIHKKVNDQRDIKKRNRLHIKKMKERQQRQQQNTNKKQSKSI